MEQNVQKSIVPDINVQYVVEYWSLVSSTMNVQSLFGYQQGKRLLKCRKKRGEANPLILHFYLLAFYHRVADQRFGIEVFFVHVNS